MERLVRLPFGELPGAVFLGIAATDTFTHGWDLARATGGDERLDPVVVDAVAAWFDTMEAAYRSAGAIGAPVELVMP